MWLGTKVRTNTEFKVRNQSERFMSMPFNALKRVFRFRKQWLNLSTEKQIQIIIF